MGLQDAAATVRDQRQSGHETPQAQANGPTQLASNTTGFADSVVLGLQDCSFVGLCSAQVTFDFGDMVIVKRHDPLNAPDQTDFNLYERNSRPGKVNSAIARSARPA